LTAALRHAALTSLAFALVFTAASPAAAESAEAAAERLDRSAAERYERGEMEAALADLEAAQRLLPASSRVYNIARCHDRLGHVTEAVAHYERYIALDDTSGEHRRLALERLEALRAQVLSPRSPGDGDGGDGRTTTTTSTTLPEEPARDSRGRVPPAVFYALLGVTAASGVALAVTGGLALQRQREFEQTAVDSADGDELRERGEPLALAADVLIGVTAAAGLATLIVAIFTRWRGEAPRAAVSLSPTRRGAALGASVSF
jgi:tetratricopeptide (TPR) repeat protein